MLKKHHSAKQIYLLPSKSLPSSGRKGCNANHSTNTKLHMLPWKKRKGTAKREKGYLIQSACVPKKALLKKWYQTWDRKEKSSRHLLLFSYPASTDILLAHPSHMHHASALETILQPLAAGWGQECKPSMCGWTQDLPDANHSSKAPSRGFGGSFLAHCTEEVTLKQGRLVLRLFKWSRPEVVLIGLHWSGDGMEHGKEWRDSKYILELENNQK